MSSKPADSVRLAGVFAELEGTAAGPGRVYRRQVVSDRYGLVLFINTDSGTHGIRFEFNSQVEAPESVSQVDGLRIQLESRESAGPELTLEQIKPQDKELFGVLAEDLVRAAGANPGIEARAVLDRVNRWRAFFARVDRGLTREEQNGLFGELTVLQKLAQEGMGIEAAVDLWEGPRSEVHDFSAASWALEVKTTASRGAGLAAVSSERQLDPTGVGSLFLVFLALDVRPHGLGRSLPQLVSQVRSALAASDVAALRFEDLLFKAGYLDLEARAYTSRYEIARFETFAVLDDFPSLRASQIPTPVVDVRFAVNLDQCQSWRVSFESTVDVLKDESES